MDKGKEDYKKILGIQPKNEEPLYLEVIRYSNNPEKGKLILPKLSPDFQGTETELRNLQKWYESNERSLSPEQAEEIRKAVVEIRARMRDLWTMPVFNKYFKKNI